MIFILDDDLENHLNRVQCRDAIHQLSMAHRSGKHILYASRNTLQAIIKHPKLSETAKKVCRSVLSKIMNVNSLYDKAILRVRVISSGKKPIKIKLDGKHEILLPLRYINNTDITSKTILLGEYKRDSEIYFAYAKTQLRHENISGVELSAHFASGNGGNTGKHYEDYQIDQNYLCLCLVDSDKKYPKDKIKNTAGSVKNLDRTAYPLSSYHIIDIHELENLIDINLISDCYNNNADFLNNKIKIRLISQFNGEKFLDLKSGLKKYTLLSDTRSCYTRFWKQIVDVGITSSIKCDKTQSTISHCSKFGDCSCIIIKPTPYMAAHALEKFKGNGYNSYHLPEDSNIDEIKKITDLIFSWCCSLKKNAFT